MTRTVRTTTTTTTVTTTTPEELPRYGTPPVYADFFNMVQPRLHRGLLMRNYNAASGSGIITVIIARNNTDATRFYCMVGAVGSTLTLEDPLPASIPATHHEMRRVGPSGTASAHNWAI